MQLDTLKLEAPFISIRIRPSLQNIPRMRFPKASGSLQYLSRERALQLRKSYSVSCRIRFTVVSYDQPIGSIREFRLKPPTIIGLEKKVIATLVVRPNMRPEAEGFMKRHFSQFSDNVCGILAYIDETTLDFLDKIPKDSTIRLLASATGGSATRLSAKLCEERQKRAIDVTQVTFVGDSTEQPLFHERWITDGKVLIDIGTDLKSSSIAAKQHTISIYDVRAYQDRIDNFEWYWKSDEFSLSSYFGGRVRKRNL